jgi:hypothetical protein
MITTVIAIIFYIACIWPMALFFRQTIIVWLDLNQGRDPAQRVRMINLLHVSGSLSSGWPILLWVYYLIAYGNMRTLASRRG